MLQLLKEWRLINRSNEMKQLIHPLIIALLLIHANPVFADTEAEFKKAEQAYRNKDSKTFFEIINRLARQGNAKAQYALSTIYEGYGGTGIEKNEEESVKWLTLSATQGFPRAEYYIGMKYSIGKNPFPRDLDESLKWYKKSAEHGFINAQHSLGMRYYMDTPKDYVKAYKWLHIAGEKGYLMAKKTLRELEAIMPPEKIAHAKMLAQKWKSNFKTRD